MGDDETTETELAIQCVFCAWAIAPEPIMLRDTTGDLYSASWAFAQLHMLQEHPDRVRDIIKDPEFQAIVLAEELRQAGLEVKRA